MLVPAFVPAVLAFADGSVFFGGSAGFAGRGALAAGEVVFNTAITGYQEVLTDPSYARQIVVFTHPHIGNTGVNSADDESPRVFAAGCVAREIGGEASSWRAESELREFLRGRRVPAVCGVDTRAITRKLREEGALSGCVAAGGKAETLAQRALAAAREFAGLRGALLADSAGGKKRAHKLGEWDWNANGYAPVTVPASSADDNFNGGGNGGKKSKSKNKEKLLRVVVLDCGAKKAILHSLTARGCDVVVLPYESGMQKVIAEKPDGVLISNGPGDPQPCLRAQKLAEDLMARGIPLFGLCLGHQIVSAALGAKIVKMKFGHHGANHPVRAEGGGVLITSQNHGFAVDAASLPSRARITHTSLFDGTLQGIACRRPPLMTFQGHPEASPGPRDAAVLFDDFARMMQTHRGQK